MNKRNMIGIAVMAGALSLSSCGLVQPISSVSSDSGSVSDKEAEYEKNGELFGGGFAACGIDSDDIKLYAFTIYDDASYNDVSGYTFDLRQDDVVFLDSKEAININETYDKNNNLIESETTDSLTVSTYLDSDAFKYAIGYSLYKPYGAATGSALKAKETGYHIMPLEGVTESYGVHGVIKNRAGGLDIQNITIIYNMFSEFKGLELAELDSANNLVKETDITKESQMIYKYDMSAKDNTLLVKTMINGKTDTSVINCDSGNKTIRSYFTDENGVIKGDDSIAVSFPD